MDKKFPKITYTFIQPWPKSNWAESWTDHVNDDSFIRMINEMTTELTLTSQDMQEVDVVKSKNQDAIDMLQSIGIKC